MNGGGIGAVANLKSSIMSDTTSINIFAIPVAPKLWKKLVKALQMATADAHDENTEPGASSFKVSDQVSLIVSQQQFDNRVAQNVWTKAKAATEMDTRDKLTKSGTLHRHIWKGYWVCLLFMSYYIVIIRKQY